MEKKYFERNFEIRSYECDFRGRLHPLSLFNFMQELASHHASRLGFSVQDLMQKQMTWVLSRIHLVCLKIPVWGEMITGRTWPSGRQGKYALRDFRFFNPAGQVIANGTSSWMIIDLKQRVSLKLDNLLDPIHVWEERALADDFSPLPGLDSVEHEVIFPVRYADLDVNRHVNHVVYIAWGLESLPEAVVLKHYPMDIEVAYRREVFWGDKIISKSCRDGNSEWLQYQHQIVHEESGQEIARMRTRWV